MTVPFRYMEKDRKQIFVRERDSEQSQRLCDLWYGWSSFYERVVFFWADTGCFCDWNCRFVQQDTKRRIKEEDIATSSRRVGIPISVRNHAWMNRKNRTHGWRFYFIDERFRSTFSLDFALIFRRLCGGRSTWKLTTCNCNVDAAHPFDVDLRDILQIERLICRRGVWGRNGFRYIDYLSRKGKNIIQLQK